MTYTVKVSDTFNFQSKAYLDLFEETDCSAFCSPLWLSNFYEKLAAPPGAEPVIVQIYDKDDLLAVLPLIRRRHLFFNMIEFADLGLSDYCDFPASTRLDVSVELTKSVLRAISPYDFVSLRKIKRPDIGKFNILGPHTITQSPFHSYASTLARPFSEWRKQSCSESFQYFLDRKLRLLQRHGDVKLTAVTKRVGIEAAFDSMKAFRATRFDTMGIADPLQKPDALSFYKSIGVQGAAEGSAITYALSLGDRLIAVIFGLIHQRTFSFLLMGFDFESYRNYSIGLLTIERTISARVDEDDVCFDFMIGEQPYKKDFGSTATEIFSIWKGNGAMRDLAIRTIAGSRPLQRIAKLLVRN